MPNHIYAQALWYAWGRKDERAGHPSGVTLPADSVDVFDFAAHVEDTYLANTTHTKSIQDLWAEYLKARTE